MTTTFDPRTVAGRFRLVALLEAFSWVGLLIGMYFKYLSALPTEAGVSVFGPVHGGLFIAYLVTGVFAGLAFKWSVATWVLALLGSIVPLCSVIFVLWADRAGKLGEVRQPAALKAPSDSAG